MLPTLERLLQIQVTDVASVLAEATNLIAGTLEVDKVDAFFYDPAADTLVAAGTSDTPMGRRQKALGLDRLPVSNGGRTVQVFTTGEPVLINRADEDPHVVRGVREALGVRSMLGVPLPMGAERRGVLLVASAKPDQFGDDDLRFLTAVAHWVGTLVHRAELVKDIARDAAERARRVTAEELIRVLAHDMNNLLAPLKGRVDLIRRRARVDPPEVVVEHAAAAAGALDRLRQFVGDLLDAERLQRGLFALSKEPCDLAALARDVAQAMAGADRPVALAGESQLVIDGDSARLRQVVENLVGNAIRFSPPGTPVSVMVGLTSEDGSPWAALTVSDCGPGIPPEILPHLFDRFAPGAGSTGLGLGLYIAHRVATAHGGRLTAESKLGHGATFRLLLPRGSGRREGPGREGPGREGPGREGVLDAGPPPGPTQGDGD